MGVDGEKIQFRRICQAALNHDTVAKHGFKSEPFQKDLKMKMHEIISITFYDDYIEVLFKQGGNVMPPHKIYNVQQEVAGRKPPDRALMEAIQSALASVILR